MVELEPFTRVESLRGKGEDNFSLLWMENINDTPNLLY